MLLGSFKCTELKETMEPGDEGTQNSKPPTLLLNHFSARGKPKDVFPRCTFYMYSNPPIQLVGERSYIPKCDVSSAKIFHNLFVIIVNYLG